MAINKNVPFSERNGYVNPSKVLILKTVPIEVSNAICSALSRVVQEMDDDAFMSIGKVKPSEKLSQYIWSHFWTDNILEAGYQSKHCWDEVVAWLGSKEIKWYYKIDFIEFIFDHLSECPVLRKKFVDELNGQFETLTFGYRIIEGHVVDVVSEQEIRAIEAAIDASCDQVSNHLKNALTLYAERPEADYPNSIKESISAVEAQLRLMTSKSTLGKALDALQKTERKVHPRLKDTIEQLYAYTNQPDTGIRHSRVEGNTDNIPSSDEALFMLVTCSAVVNYLKTKC